MPLLTASKTYKPFEYPWAFEFWKRQQQIHWMPEAPSCARSGCLTTLGDIAIA